MTWRQFTVLLNNLNPFGATASRMEQLKAQAKKDRQGGEAAADAFFSSVFSVSGA